MEKISLPTKTKIAAWWMEKKSDRKISGKLQNNLTGLFVRIKFKVRNKN
jgi:hypothetical protein